MKLRNAGGVQMRRLLKHWSEPNRGYRYRWANPDSRSMWGKFWATMTGRRAA